MAYEIAFGVDTGYVKYAGIVMTSIAAENAGEEIGFHLVSACASSSKEIHRRRTGCLQNSTKDGI